MYTRFSRWGKSGVWQRVIEAVHGCGSGSAPVDITIVRAHQHAAGAQKKKGASDWPLARRVEYKIHMAVDALGNPLRWHLTGGEVHDITQAPALIAGVNAQQVIADKGYDSDAFVAYIAATGRKPLSRRAKSVEKLDLMIALPTVSAISSSASSVVSSSFAGSPHVMKNSPATSYQCSISPPPTSGWSNCKYAYSAFVVWAPRRQVTCGQTYTSQ